jgi:hypothetical protein
MTSTQVLLGRRTGTRVARALARLLPRYVTSNAGFEPTFPWCEVSEIFATGVRRAARRGKPNRKRIPSRRSERRAAIANPTWFALPSVSGLRLVPSGRPRASGARMPARAQGSGSPVPASPENFRRSLASENKIPSGAASSEGPVSGLSISLRRDRLQEPGTRHRLAGSHSIGG